MVDDGARPVHLFPALLLSYMAYVKRLAVQSFQCVPENQANIVQGMVELRRRGFPRSSLNTCHRPASSGTAVWPHYAPLRFSGLAGVEGLSINFLSIIILVGIR